MNQNAILPDNGSPARLLLRLPICDKELTQEESRDFTLPDYLPEIRKMLRVSVTLEPPESYASAAEVEYSGKLCYRVLYVGADGTLQSAELPSEYGFKAPLDVDERCDLSMGIDAWADCTPELLVTRVLSPRKLNVRCRMRARAHAYGWHTLEEVLTGSPRGRVERLVGMTDCAVVLRGTADGIELSDELIPDAGGDTIRVISCEGHVFVSEAVPENGRVNLRGEVAVKLLTVKEQASDGGTEALDAPLPTVVQRKIPFAGAIELDEVDRYFDCRGFGVVSRLSCSVEDGRIIIDAVVTLCAECQKNRRFAYTRDLFSTGAACETAHGNVTLPFALRMSNGNFTLSDSVPLEGSGIAGSDRIVDVTGELAVGTAEESGGKVIFSGEGHFHVLARKSDGDEYASAEIVLPFRYTADSASETNKSLPSLSAYDAYLEPVTMRARCDGERLSIDAEISVAYRTAGETDVRLLTSARFGEPIPKPRGQILLYYPTPSDTLWDAARRYHVSPETLAAENALDPVLDAPLKEVRFLVVEG